MGSEMCIRDRKRVCSQRLTSTGMGPEGLLPKWRARATRQFQILKETSHKAHQPRFVAPLLPQIITIIPWNAGDWKFLVDFEVSL